MPRRPAPRLGRLRDARCVVHTGPAQRAQRAVDRPDSPQRGRHPDHVDVEGKPAAGVSDTAVAPAARMPPTVGVALEAHEIRRDRLISVWGGLPPYERQVLAERDVPARYEAALARIGHRAVREITSSHDGELEIVVHHPIVLARRLHVAHQRPVAGLQKLGGILANRLAAERFFVADVAGGSEFLERGTRYK